MEKEITTTNQTTALADSLIVVQQLPIIKEQLHSIKAQAQESVKEVLSLACTEETLKVVKERRAALNRDRKDRSCSRLRTSTRFTKNALRTCTARQMKR